MFVVSEKQTTLLAITPSKAVAKSERAELIEKFTDKLNASRLGTQYKTLQARTVAILINQHPLLKGNSALYEFYLLCEEAKSFSAKFFWTVKVK